MYVIPCLTWVRKGRAKSNPDRVRLTEDELEELMLERANRSSKGDNSAALPVDCDTRESGDDDDQSSDDGGDGVDARYGLEDYDESYKQDEEAGGSDQFGVSSLAFYKSNKSDPFLNQENLSDEEDDLHIQSDDNMVVIGKFCDDYSNLNAYIYNEKQEYLYCHHDSLLPSLPLCVEWLDFDPGEEEPGNLVAVGSMEPNIDIWDLDVLDTLEPAFTLLGESSKRKKNKKKVKVVHGHKDAVLDLAWNRQHRNVLASASADCTVGLWDLSDGQMVCSITEHKDKVQSINWHPVEEETIVSGGYDHKVKIFDCRSPHSSIWSQKFSSEIEKVLWNHHDPFYFIVATEEGNVLYCDSRSKKPVFTLHAHSDSVSGVALSPTIPGCLITCSGDKSVKVWDIKDHKPKTIFSKELNIGKLHSLAACPDSDLLYAVGGERELRILNLKKQSAVAGHFGLQGSSSTTSDSWEVHRADESESSDDEMQQKKKMTSKKKNKLQKKVPGRDVVSKLGEPSSRTSTKKKLKKKKKLNKE